MAEGRAALDSLRSSTTETNDLLEAMRRATESAMIPPSMNVTCSTSGEKREMHPIVRDEIYRIGYQAIVNASAHSGANRLSIEIEYAQNLVLRVKDNGSGIEPEVVEQGKPGHFGLQGMRERASRIEGKLTISSGKGAGTTVTLVVPGGIAFRKDA
jgi:signal transduction histidine kinase